MPLSFSFRIRGASLGMPGLFTTSSAFRISSSVWCPSSQAMSYLFSSSLYLSLIADMSETNVSSPFTLASTAAPAPLSPAPNTTIRVLFSFSSPAGRAVELLLSVQLLSCFISCSSTAQFLFFLSLSHLLPSLWGRGWGRSSLSYLQCNDGDGCQHDGYNPEADGNL